MPTARCHFSDGQVFDVQADPGEAFLDAALRAGAPIRYQCRSGSCLSCACRSSAEGGLCMRPGVASSLLPGEIADGRRLSCVGQLLADDELHFDYASNDSGPAKVSAFVDNIEWMADDAVRLRVELAEGDWLDFKPGQYVRIGIPGSEETRSYSMSTTPAALPMLEFMIRVLDQGVMSDYLRQRAQVDDVLTLTGPYGGFRWDGDRQSPQLFIAGGTGLSPIASILEQIRATSGRKPPMTLSFGCATADNLFATDYLQLLAQWVPSLDVKISVQDGTREGALSGTPLDAVDFEALAPDTRAYLCGPPGMIQAAAERLRAAGIPGDQIYQEQFTPSDEGGEGGAAPCP
ncbi:MAG: FAD-binding oxidoreductase [Pseudomonadota bacterium]